MRGWEFVIVGAGMTGCVLAKRLSEDKDAPYSSKAKRPITATCARSSRRGTRSRMAHEAQETHAFVVAAMPSAQTRALTVCDS